MKGGQESKIKECKVCPAGSYAQKVREYLKFDEWPIELKRFCAPATFFGDAHDCDTTPGWFLSTDMMLDSGGVLGIPQGLKYQMKSYFHISNPNGGKIELEYRIRGISEHEKFRVMVNGDTYKDENTDTENKENDDFETWESDIVEPGP